MGFGLKPMARHAARPMRALLDEPGFGTDPHLFGCNAAPVRKVAGGCVHSPEYLCEPVGMAFAKRFDGIGREAPASGGSESEDESNNEEEYGRDRNSKEKASPGGSLKISEGLKGVNLYELLVVSEGSSQEEVKKAYRSLALSSHPDKQATRDPAEAKKVQERFVQIQEAYELLSDPAKRMQYDSSLPFDDALPKFKPADEQDFFEVFGQAFRRNGRFSSKRPVPEIGGPDDKPEVWQRFYNFWYEFKSWRDPLVLAQADDEELHDLDEAECREEKRWMVRENNRVAKVYKQAERDRIADLVRLAEKYDPRILAQKAAKTAARDAEMARRAEEKMAAQRAREEAERKRREEEEAVAAVEAERRREEKAAREEIKAEVKKCRQRLRAFHPFVKHQVLLEQLNEVCLQFEKPALLKLADDVEAALKKDVSTAASLFHQAIESIGLKPVLKVEDDNVSTSSGDSSEDPANAEELKRQEQEKETRARQAEAKRKAEEEQKAEERKKRDEDKAEEKKKRDELRRKEQAQAETKKRQQEKKEEEKAKRAEEKAKKAEEQDALRREQQREEARKKAQEQAEKDRREAAVKQQEMEAERVEQLFVADRLERLNKLEPMSDQNLVWALDKALADDAPLRAAFQQLRKKAQEPAVACVCGQQFKNDIAFCTQCGEKRGCNNSDAVVEMFLDHAMALVSKVGVVWPLGLAPPAEVKVPNAVRNRVKKARMRLREVVASILAKADFAVENSVQPTEWQQGILDGSIEIPSWSPQEGQDEEPAAKPAAQQEVLAEVGEASPTASPKKGKKAKESKQPNDEENLDELLAEFGVTIAEKPKKAGKKKK